MPKSLVRKQIEHYEKELQVLKEIERLGKMSPKKLAAYLQKEGIKVPTTYKETSCPLATHLRKKFKGEFRVNSDCIECDINDDCDSMDVEIRGNLSDFVDAFDTGKFRFLKEGV